MTINHTDNDPIDGYSLIEYRNAVAKAAKLMIRARAKQEPEFMNPGEYDRWHLCNIADDTSSVEELLTLAEMAIDTLWREFIGSNGSGGIAEGDPNADLKACVVDFTNNVSPGELLDKLAAGEQIDWQTAANWQLLDEIRDGLDELPMASQDQCPVVLVDKARREMEVLSQEVHLKTLPQLNVVQALIYTYPSSLTKDQLINQSGQDDAVGILKRLAKIEAWKPVIKLAVVSGGGYGLCHPNSERK